MDSSTPPTAQESPGEQTETGLTRLSLVVSTVTTLSTLLITIASDAISAPWLLAGATVTSALCLAILFRSFRRANDPRLGMFFKLASATCCVVLSAGWLFVYRDDIWFGRICASFSKAPAVIVDEAIAHSVVSTKRGSVSKDQRLMSALDKLIQESHHTRVQPASDPAPENALLRVSGVSTESRSSLVMSVPGSNLSPTLTEDRVRHLDTLVAFTAIVAGDDRFFASAFDQGLLRVSVASPPQETSELIMMAYHALIGAKLARDNEAAATEHFLRLHELRDVVTQEQIRGMAWLPDALLFAAHLSLRARDPTSAATFIDDGRRLLPDDARLRVAAAYLKLRAGNPDLALQIIKGEHSETGDQVPSEALRGLVDLKAGSTWSALDHFEAVAEGSAGETASMAFATHAFVSLLAAAVEASPVERSEKILKHTRAAEQTIPGVPLISILSGFGSALADNGAPAEEAFARARRLAKTSTEIENCDYWQALGMAQSPTGLVKAVQMLNDLERRGVASPRLLGLLADLEASALYGSNDPSRAIELDAVKRAFALAKRALEQDSKEVHSHRVLGLHQMAQSVSMSGPARKEMMQSALEHFGVALREGGDDARVYEQMSLAYRELAQTAEAKQSEQRAYELSCRCRHDAGSCAIRDVRNLLERRNVAGAKERANDLIRWLISRPSIPASWGNSILNTLALIFYQHDQRDTAEELYESIRGNVSRQRYPQPALLGLVDCNEAFLYVDSGRIPDAARLFRRGLEATTSADCEAGLAIALKQLGRDDEAISLYQSARKRDPNYGNLGVLRKSYYWSDTALSLAKSLGGEAP